MSEGKKPFSPFKNSMTLLDEDFKKKKKENRTPITF